MVFTLSNMQSVGGADATSSRSSLLPQQSSAASWLADARSSLYFVINSFDLCRQRSRHANSYLLISRARALAQLVRIVLRGAAHAAVC